MSNRPLLSIVTPCYNEATNIDELYERIKAAITPLTQYDFELLFIDNHSEDDTVIKLKRHAARDPSVKIIVNARNFGHIRSPYYGILQSSGLATIYLASDLQDPPEKIPEFIRLWEEGYMLVMATKPVSASATLMHQLRKTYYRFLDGISDVSLLADSTGFGLYDKVVLDHLRQIQDPYPYLRGLICELGYEIKTVPFTQPRRLRGVSKNNFYTLYDMAMLGIVSHSKMPLRIASIFGFLLAFCSFFSALVFLFYKLMNWDKVPLGFAPFAILVMLLFGMMFIFIGILGEYISSIHTYVQKRPIVVEKERINF
ncbi:MAG: glycosyltransferase family 2 protein [Ottowia sp.]|nr:glycosyltransferase family 2 protein [Ottowia sp.]